MSFRWEIVSVLNLVARGDASMGMNVGTQHMPMVHAHIVAQVYYYAVCFYSVIKFLC